MTQERKRTKATCYNCGRQFSVQNSELARRVRGSSTGNVFCGKPCFQEYQRKNGR